MEDFDQYIQISTDSQPIGARSVALTGLSSRRKIQLDSPDLTLDQVSQIIKEHYIQSSGKIELFGNITAYSWMTFEDMEKSISKVFDVDGEFIKDLTVYDEL